MKGAKPNRKTANHTKLPITFHFLDIFKRLKNIEGGFTFEERVVVTFTADLQKAIFNVSEQENVFLLEFQTV